MQHPDPYVESLRKHGIDPSAFINANRHFVNQTSSPTPNTLSTPLNSQSFSTPDSSTPATPSTQINTAFRTSTSFLAVPIFSPPSREMDVDFITRTPVEEHNERTRSITDNHDEKKAIIKTTFDSRIGDLRADMQNMKHAESSSHSIMGYLPQLIGQVKVLQTHFAASQIAILEAASTVISSVHLTCSEGSKSIPVSILNLEKQMDVELKGCDREMETELRKEDARHDFKVKGSTADSVVPIVMCNSIKRNGVNKEKGSSIPVGFSEDYPTLKGHIDRCFPNRNINKIRVNFKDSEELPFQIKDQFGLSHLANLIKSNPSKNVSFTLDIEYTMKTKNHVWGAEAIAKLKEAMTAEGTAWKEIATYPYFADNGLNSQTIKQHYFRNKDTYQQSLDNYKKQE